MYNSAIASYNTNKDPWYSPIFIVKSFQALGIEYGENISKPEFKRAREMFTAAVALLGVYELSDENIYFLQINKQGNSPDVIGAKQTERKNLPILLELAQMEITEFEEHSTDQNIVDFLKKTKLSPKKSYDHETMIVCLINRTLPANSRKVSEELKNLKPKSSIYIVGRSHSEDPAKFLIFSPYPRLTKTINYDLFETSRKYKIPFIIRLHLGSDRKISYKKVHLEPLNLYEVFGINEKKIKEKYKEESKLNTF